MYDTGDEIGRFYAEQVALQGAQRTEMRERRDANRARLRKGLSDEGKPKPVGLHTQGSYAMRTMVQDADNDYDIDDGVYFDAGQLVGPLGGTLSPLAVRQMVCAAVQDDRFNRSPEVKKNCVRVYYNAGFHVDVPAYRRISKIDPWTGKTTYAFELASSVWKVSDPLAVTKWFRNCNEQLSSDWEETDGQFSRVVKLTKAFARSRPTWRSLTASGFMITKLASEVFVPSEGRDDISFRYTLKQMHNRLQIGTVVDHPTLPGATITHDDDARPVYLKDCLAENLPHLEVLDASECSHAEAMAAWDSFFWTDWFSGQPPPNGDAETGPAPKGPATPVQKVGPGRYASGSCRG